jgi:LuxR family transcriptional regulator, maltose regulon positive regulatory protein
MATRNVALAKLNPPKLFNALPRERLFDLLDAGREHSTIWVQGPPGAGKSTLVASYIEARGLPAIWYQIDAGDRDPATFFYYLGQAAQPFAHKQRDDLPVFSAQSLANVTSFARRYFRALFSLMPRPSVIVLDNYQHVEDDSGFHGVIEEALEQTPDAVCAIVVSRSAPLAQFSGLIAKQRMVTIEANSLRLTFEETRSIASAAVEADQALLSRMHAQVDGWAAGITLILDQVRRTGKDPRAIELDSKEALFNYFAGEIFERAPAEYRQVLLATALVPSMTVKLAEKVSGNPNAGKVLKDLYRRHIFLDRRAASVHVYQYHVLFREFLRDKAREILSTAEVAGLASQAAGALQESGQWDDALDLYLQAHDWNASRELILAQAPLLVAQGRGQSLRRYINALPSEVAGATPWIAYWSAMSLLATAPSEVLHRLTEVFAQFRELDEPLGQALAAAGAVEACIYDFSDFTPLDRWIIELDGLLDRELPFRSLDQEVLVHVSVLMAAIVRQPGHAQMRARIDTLWSLLGAEVGVNEKVTAAHWILAYAGLSGGFDDATRAAVMVEPLLDDPNLSPLTRAHWFRRHGYVLYLQGDYAAALAALEKGQEIAKRNEFPAALALGLYALVLVAVALGDIVRADKELAAFEAAGPPTRRPELAIWHHARSLNALHKGDFDKSFVHARAATEAAIETGWPQMETLRRLQIAFMLTEIGDFASATAEVNALRNLIAGTPLQFYECGLGFVEAYIALRQQEVAHCDALLRHALARAREIKFIFITRFLPNALPRLFEQALSAGIEVDYVREVIRRFQLSPTATAGEAWPWAVKIHTLGDFEVWKDDARIVFRGKAQKKPMDLLKALVAMGGQNVDLNRLSEALWPDSDGDTARKALETNLYRLRKLLGHDGLINLTEGKLALDFRRVWVDARAFEQEMQRRSGEPTSNARSPTELLRLYRGHFLQAEPEESWMLPMRLKLRDQLFDWLRACARQRETSGDSESAESLYKRGLEIDPLEERLYGRLMICYRDRGNHAEAMTTYLRCKDVLARLLGTPPSSETEAVRKTLNEHERSKG